MEQMNCGAWNCSNPAFICYFPELDDDPLTLCEKCYEHFRKQEEEGKAFGARVAFVARLLGQEKMSVIQCAEDSLLNELHSFVEGNLPEAPDLASLLFMAVGSSGPAKNFLESTGFEAFWQRKELVISIKDKYKGLWIGKGGKYIKAANVILNRFGYSVRIWP